MIVFLHTKLITKIKYFKKKLYDHFLLQDGRLNI